MGTLYILAGVRGEGDGPDENGDTELKEENGNGTVKKVIKEENGHGDGKDDQNGHTNGDSKQNGNNSEKEEIKEEVFRPNKKIFVLTCTRNFKTGTVAR